ncbi:MAG: hypothetical protein ACYSUF_04420 [Planctomycetota bacterium]|jgi:hypothetical protein
MAVKREAPMDDQDGGPVHPRRALERVFVACDVVRPFRRARYDPGDELEYEVTAVVPAGTGRIRCRVERYVGGGFAGQVYRVKLLQVNGDTASIGGLEPGRSYAVKILKPASAFARLFRGFLYALAFQGAFSAQVNPSAVRVGVLWQKLIRRAAAGRFGTENAVCDTYATFYDPELGSFGEINEWVDGRIWRFEVDDRLFDRWKFEGAPPDDVNCPEYVNKKLFMRQLVKLMHEMGAPELARQYEWWSGKSQPNALKRIDGDGSPWGGLTAIDFRAGLALLPVLPMSPVDFLLILRGLARGRLVQFDKSRPQELDRFVADRSRDFEDLEPVLEELRRHDPQYRRSLPDVTYHHLRLLTDRSLRGSVKHGVITAWRSRGRIDNGYAEQLEQGRAWFAPIWLLSLVPLLGPFVLRLRGHRQYREHIRRALTGRDYFRRALRAKAAEKLVIWHRTGRVSDERALALVDRPLRFWLQRFFLGWLPATWHRAMTEPRWVWSLIREKVRYFLQFLRDPPFRERWLLEEVRLGHAEGMLTADEAQRIAGQVKDPYIQKYLRCLAVHLCTVPVTQVVMLVVGALVTSWALVSQDLTWPEAVALGVAAAAVVQLLPISPGSMARGLFVVFLMVKERDIRNYRVAAPVSFLHVIGYLAFPLQMVAHNPALARFLAGRWAKSMVHFVPVFGESGGLLEHGVFDLFFNMPLSVRRRFRTYPVRSWTLTIVLLAVLVLAAVTLYLRFT